MLLFNDILALSTRQIIYKCYLRNTPHYFWGITSIENRNPRYSFEILYIVVRVGHVNHCVWQLPYGVLPHLLGQRGWHDSCISWIRLCWEKSKPIWYGYIYRIMKKILECEWFYLMVPHAMSTFAITSLSTHSTGFT